MNQSQVVATFAPEAQPDKADPIKIVAADLNISIPTLYREAALRRLRISKIGARSVIFRSDHQAYIDLLKSEADARETEPVA